VDLPDLPAGFYSSFYLPGFFCPSRNILGDFRIVLATTDRKKPQEMTKNAK
jgi:hypothetical protein